jgi:site-specific recombinase XerD
MGNRLRCKQPQTKYLKEERLTADDVFLKLKQHKNTNRTVEVLSDEEKKKLLDAIESDSWAGQR